MFGSGSVRVVIAASVLALLAAAAPAGSRGARGTLDTRFARDGVAVLDFGAIDEAHQVATMSDGRVVAAGVTGGFGAGRLAIARYKPNGKLDRSFSKDGKVVRAFDDFITVTDLVVAKGGVIVVALTMSRFVDAECCEYAAMVAKFNKKGKPIRTFGEDGSVTLALPGGRVANAISGDVLVGNDGSVTLGGTVFAHAAQEDIERQLAQTLPSAVPPIDIRQASMYAARVDATGALDPAFGTGGVAVVNADGAPNQFRSMVRANGSITVAGRTEGDPRPGVIVARMDMDGHLDPVFGPGGVITIRPGLDRDTRLAGLAALKKGKTLVVATGRAGPPSFPDESVVLMRLLDDGSLDPRFGKGGVKRVQTTATTNAYEIVAKKSGALYALGTVTCESFYCGSRGVVLALNAKGAFDKRFGLGGIMYAPDEVLSARGIALAGSKPIVVGSILDRFGSSEFCQDGFCIFFGNFDLDFFTARIRG